MAQNGTAPGASFYVENGRQYTTFRRTNYMFPIDEEEKERLDCFHAVIFEARHKRHWDRPVPERARVLDLGAGTGIWAIDASEVLWKDAQNHGRILGLDIAYIQPATVPSTVSFLQTDMEESWPLPSAEYDLVHIQMLFGAIRDWSEVYRKAHRHLKPGGFIEHVEVEWKFYSDDDTVPPEANMHVWSNTLHRVMQKAGMPIGVTERTKQDLLAAGFTDITEEIVKLPVSPWDKDPAQNRLGRVFNHGVTTALDALSLGPFTRLEGWSPDQVRTLTSRVKQEVCMLRHHAYCRLFVWTARKPT